MLGRELENTELVRKAQRSQFYAGGRAENPVDQNSEYRTLNRFRIQNQALALRVSR